ncbi:N-(5-phosphoribosyl)anthranilate isomerase (PRAI) [Liquorilactobacillus aquaticus DSM 21051]|uniref:N-(5'-phosphoribosyl)anthranilate isomerase n=1 Tax=Liquorilactobacillus aquaticus DSM 21051 TaxID=1423725 RepID=A0A0R2CWQ3_9LACO|nr:phosphoribosylanthranilate isomerase [Liquorilactobacillus aquaticus]KRM96200.1 N-(5-phosphoribosyl)anthranilate isomerase (PRAI) [Liquorilactobacillus aquaticus DSM 21051]
MTKIKICGLKRNQDIHTVNKLLPEFIGFVFAPSQREISFEQAKKLHSLLSPLIKTVGVFVEPSNKDVLALYSMGVIQIAQLHGNIAHKQINFLQKNGLKTIHVVKNARSAKNSPAEYVMFDSPNPGSGKTADLDKIPRQQRPFVIAGGLNSSNVTQVIEKFHPDIVDVSSSIETNGKKDPQKIKEFIRSVRNAK